MEQLVTLLLNVNFVYQVSRQLPCVLERERIGWEQEGEALTVVIGIIWRTDSFLETVR